MAVMITTGWEKYASIEGEAALKKALAEVIRERDSAQRSQQAALQRCQILEHERQQLYRERDEARALVFRIGLRLRQHYSEEQDGWTPGAAFEIYRWIDELERQMPPRGGDPNGPID